MSPAKPGPFQSHRKGSTQLQSKGSTGRDQQVSIFAKQRTSFVKLEGAADPSASPSFSMVHLRIYYSRSSSKSSSFFPSERNGSI